MNGISPRIVYITHARLTSGRAHVIALIKLCEAFAARGEAIEIIAPRYWPGRRGGEAALRFTRPLRVRTLFAVNALWLGAARRPAFFLQILLFSVSATLYALWRYRSSWRQVVFFSHDHLPLYFLSFFTDRIFYDIHHFPGRNFIYRRVLRRARGFAVQTRWKIGALREFGVAVERVVYWPNGTDVEAFRLGVSRLEARRALGLAEAGSIVLYAGNLFDWKGVETLIRSVALLPEDAAIYIVGGSAEDIAKVRSVVPEARHQRVIFIGFEAHERMPWWLKAADVLVLPNTGRQRVSLYYTSPMKLFEYMASNRPIVAARIPSLEEILDEDNAFLAEADNPTSFANVIRFALVNVGEAGRRADKAAREVTRYTWGERARIISEHVDAIFV